MFPERDPRKRAIIVASGPSAKVMRFMAVNEKTTAIIAVNGALQWLPRFDYFFTLDPSTVNRQRMETRYHRAKYFVAYPESEIPMPDHVIRLERISHPSPNGEAIIDGKYTCAVGLNTTPGHINSGNSAFGAVNLAYHLGFETVGIIGVDANDAPRLEGGHSRDLSHLPQLFESAMGQIKLINCGDMQSMLPKVSIKHFLKGYNHENRVVLHPQLAV